MSSITDQKPLYSSLASDPDMVELVELFVEEMPERIDALLDMVREADMDGLQRMAHQLKGAAGSYGFEDITVAAAKLERTLREEADRPHVDEALAALVTLCRRAKTGPSH
jgi:HPt (histidine-containing phosphotransfer) domain-containing protein